MWHFLSLNKEEFLAHYHQRSDVESAAAMIKTKFGPSTLSRRATAAKNEVLAKVLCHNLGCLITAVYELGLKPVLAA